MKLHNIYFSPTGGTKRVMELLGSELATGWRKVDLSKYGKDYSKYCYDADDVCLIGVPAFGGRVPDVALKNLRQMKPNHARAVLVVTYGNRAYDDTLLELKNETETMGFEVIGAVAAVTEHSIMHQYGTGRPDADDREELRTFAKHIRRRLEREEKFTDIAVPGNEPYREYHGVPLKPKAGNACNNCGTCAALCPVGAISEENSSETDSEKCISCMRCIAVCPSKARSLNKIMLIAASQKLKKACAQRKNNQIFLGVKK